MYLTNALMSEDRVVAKEGGARSTTYHEVKHEIS